MQNGIDRQGKEQHQSGDTVLRRRRANHITSSSSVRSHGDSDDETQAGAVAVYLTHTERIGEPNGIDAEDPMFASNGSMIQQDLQSQILLEGELVRSEEINARNRQIIESETKERVIGTIAQAEAVSENENQSKTQTSQWRKGYVIVGVILVILVVAVGVVLGVVFSRGDGDDNRSRSTKEDSGHPIGTIYPTSRQPPTPMITSFPSISLSSMPSVIPSASPSTMGDNSDCSEAHPLTINQVRRGSFVPSQESPTSYFDCLIGSGMVNNGFKRWYQYTGEGHPVMASAPSFILQVYRAADVVPSCWSNQCEQSAFFSQGDKIQWVALDSVEYLVEVICKDQCRGNGFVGSVPFELSLQRNDSPERGYGPIVLTETLFLPGKIYPALMDASGAPPCGDASSPVTDVSWFSVQGTGNAMKVSTCGITTWDTQISVLSRRQEDGTWTCVGGNDDACGSGQSEVLWNSLESEVYYIAVHGGAENLSSAGALSFVLQIDAEGLGDGINPGDICDTAEMVQLSNGEFNYSYPVVLGRATDDADFPFDCYETNVLIAGDLIPTGLFYQVEGTGGFLTLELESVMFENFVSFSVLTGSCTDLSCVVSDCERGCSWFSVLGAAYYIFAYHLTFPYESEEVFAQIRVFNG